MDPVSSLREQLAQQLEQNQKLREETNDLSLNNDGLRGFKKGLQLKTKPFKQQQNMITSSLKSVASINESSIIRSQHDIDKLNHDDVFIPVAVGLPGMHVNCPGCGQQFKRIGESFEPAYYIHCIKECDDYKKLGIIRKCSGCLKHFINAVSMMWHKCGLPTRPSWMAPRTFRSGWNNDEYKDARCPGCNVLIAKATNGRNHSMEFMCHVIEECEEYKKLDRIKECVDCGYKFMNARAYSRHRWAAHKEKVTHHCHVCKLEFDGYGKLSRHLKTRSHVRPFKCTSCGANFKWKASLNLHLRRKACSKNVK